MEYVNKQRRNATWIWSLGIQLQEGSPIFDKVSVVAIKTERTKIHDLLSAVPSAQGYETWSYADHSHYCAMVMDTVRPPCS